MKIKPRSKKAYVTVLPLILMIVMSVSFLGCAKSGKSEDTFYVYDVNRDYTRLIANEYNFSENYSLESEAKSKYVGEALNRMMAGPEEPDEVAAIDASVGKVTYRIDGSVANVNFESSYYDADLTHRTLRRAAIVRTLCQIDGIQGVSITVDHEAVMDSDGQPIGILTADSYLENDGAKINAYEKTSLNLYFTDGGGDSLLKTTETVVYDSNISMERLVVDHLIQGPTDQMVLEGICPTINPSTKILNVTVKDGICYVNLSSDFLTKVTNVSDETVVYSIVNSLTELANENKVQLMVDGETEVSFGNIYLSSPFESNYDITSKN